VPPFTAEFTVLLPGLNAASDLDGTLPSDNTTSVRVRYLTAIKASAPTLVESAGVLSVAAMDGGGLRVITQVLVNCSNCSVGARNESLARFMSQLDALISGILLRFDLAGVQPFQGIELAHDESVRRRLVASRAATLAPTPAGIVHATSISLEDPVNDIMARCKTMDDDGWICSRAECGALRGKQFFGACCSQNSGGHYCNTVGTPPNGCGGNGIGDIVPPAIIKDMRTRSMTEVEAAATMEQWTQCCYRQVGIV
jgi:hypothetical protein